MPETKFGPLSSLVGRTFEKGTTMRTVRYVQGENRRTVCFIELGYSYMMSMAATRFCAWLTGATEVKDETANSV